MFFSSPLWLLALIPWTALVIWMFRGQSSRVSVPFINLWRGDLNVATARRSLVPPSFPVIVILLALVLAIFVAAGPRIRSRLTVQPITIIVDRGLTMMPESRSASILQRANRELLNAFSSLSPVSLISIPGGQLLRTDLSDWLSQALDLPQVPIATDQEIQQAIRNAQAGTLVVAITDKAIEQAGQNFIQFAPDPIKNNVGIVSVGARQGTSSELMVRIRNDSDFTKITLRVSSGPLVINREITLPPRGEQQNFFFPTATLGPTVEVSILDPDDFPLDNIAWLARERSFPKITTTSNVNPEVQRVIKAFQKSHPPEANSQTLLIASANSPEPTADVTIASSLEPVPQSTIDITTHAITANLTVTSLSKLSAAASAPKDWLPLLRAGGRTLLAIRDTPRRQVWIGFTADNFAATADFVVLWTNILNWLSNSSDEYTSNPITSLSSDWTPVTALPQSAPHPGLSPGIYRSPDGTLRAQNISPTTFSTSPTRSTVIPRSFTNTSAIDASQPILFLILVLLMLAALTWPAPGLTRPFRAS
jgi:hypothetical protein